jgi:hypothetical protein
MDKEFVQVLNVVLKSELHYEIICDAIKLAQEHPYIPTPAHALAAAYRDWEK